MDGVPFTISTQPLVGRYKLVMKRAYKASGNKSSRLIDTQSKAHDETGTQITKTFDANSNHIESLSKSQYINLRFGDFKCLGGSYGMTVNVIINNCPQPPADGELKVPWVHEHRLGEIHHRYEDELHAGREQPKVYNYDIHSLLSKYEESVSLHALAYSARVALGADTVTHHTTELFNIRAA